MPVRLEPAAPRSRVKHSTTEPLRSHILLYYYKAVHRAKCYEPFNIGHRPVNVKRAVIGSKGGWKLSTIFLSCKVFHDWSIIKLGNILYLLDGSIFVVLFGTTFHCFC